MTKTQSITTTSPGLSLRLNMAGFPQKISHDTHAWVNGELHLIRKDNDLGWLVGDTHGVCFDSDTGIPKARSAVSEFVRALTSDELIAELPVTITVVESDGKHAEGTLVIYRDESGYAVFYEDMYVSGRYKQNKSLPEALALLWLWCKENGYLETK